jgi:type I restriction enzyme R subunit
MYDKVKKHWVNETERVQKELGEIAYQPRGGEMTPEQAKRDLRFAELKQRLDVLTSTDMAVIVSPGQNEIAQMQKLGINIEPHRKRMNDSQPGLDEKFKDTDDPLRLVFVWGVRRNPATKMKSAYIIAKDSLNKGACPLVYGSFRIS